VEKSTNTGPKNAPVLLDEYTSRALTGLQQALCLAVLILLLKSSLLTGLPLHQSER
jgi:hypothetical protein